MPTVRRNGTCFPVVQNHTCGPENPTAPVRVSTVCEPDETSVARRPVVPLRSVIAVGPVSVKRPIVGAAASTAPMLFTVTSSGNPQSAVSTP